MRRLFNIWRRVSPSLQCFLIPIHSLQISIQCFRNAICANIKKPPFKLLCPVFWVVKAAFVGLQKSPTAQGIKYYIAH